jgi:oligosaccharide repeat unit polymerase
MADYRIQNPMLRPEKRNGLLYPIFFLWGLVVVAIFALFVFEEGLAESLAKYYLLPWTFMTGAVILTPSLYLFFKKKFDPFHPLVFPVWSYFFPAFFVGGLILTFNLSQPYYLAFVQDERYELPLTLVFVMLGFAGLSIGFALPVGKIIGSYISRWLPAWQWKPEQVMKPGVLLLGIGLINTGIAFGMGVLGFQKVEEIGAFDGIIFLLSLFWLEASFLLWLCIFRTENKFTVNHYFIIALLLITSFTKSAFQGNRGSLIQLFILIAFAFVFSGRKIEFKHKVFSGILLSLALIFGMIYGTTFRTIKTTEERMGMEEYASVIMQTFEKVSDQDLGTVFENGFTAIAERFESVSSLAVVVSNYEKLGTYEQGYGLDNNIWKDSITFLIPRILWTDKPVATDPGNYGDLYFNFRENSFTITPMGDLLRNFGPIGIPVGMFVLGLFIRTIYSALRENQEFSFWRATIFYMLLTSISYEGSYGLIIPYLVKICIVSAVGILIVRFFVGKTRVVL